MRFKYLINIPTVMFILFLSSLSWASSGNEAKMKICHYEKKTDKEGRVLVISASALPAHRKHGDPKEYYVLSEVRCIKIEKK